jgi:hypothetical protein
MPASTNISSRHFGTKAGTSHGRSTSIPRRPRTRSLFERAAADDRVFVTNDRPAEAIAIGWLREERRFRGMVAWPVGTYEHRTIGELALDFEALAKEQDPFAYPIRHLKTR